MSKKYDICDNIVQSDHKPVFSQYVVPIKRVKKEEKKRISEEIMAEIDCLYRNAIESIECQPESLVFDNVYYKVPKIQRFLIINNGNHVASFKLLFDKTLSWLNISHVSGSVIPNEKLEINITAYITEKEVRKANYYESYLNTELTLCIVGLIEKTVPVKLNFVKTCFGCEFSDLIKILIPISGVQGTIKDFTNSAEGSLDLPKELYKLVEYIKETDQHIESLFENNSNYEEVGEIRKCIDRLEPFHTKISIYSVFKVTVELLETMPKPLLPAQVFDRFIEETPVVHGASMKEKLKDKLTSANWKVLLYLFEFFKWILSKSSLLIDRIVEGFMFPILRVKKTHENEILMSKRRLYFKLLMHE